jgi:hypothetical protein
MADPEGNEFDVEIGLTQLDEDQRRSLFNQAVLAADSPVQR